ncbi:uncharacterized protein V6R79_003975 [Siganus canaliculatus]
MTRAALTKLFILVILAFIICLPEFFTLYKVSKVHFLCLPYRPCERGEQVKTGENGKIRNADSRGKDMCDPSQSPEQWWEACGIRTDPVSNGSDGGSERSWFWCKTDVDMGELDRNLSFSALRIHFEVSMELHLRDAETLNVTLYGLGNHSSLHFDSPEEEEEEEDEEDEEHRDKKADEGKKKAFYCCLPSTPISTSANGSRCLLQFANQTDLTATARKELPWKRTQKDEWRCMIRVLWLVLLFVLLLTIVTSVFGQIYGRKHSSRRSKVNFYGYHFTGDKFNDGATHTDVIIPKDLLTTEMILDSDTDQSWSVLPPIREVDSQDNIETLLDGNTDQCFSANLHHRNHPPLPASQRTRHRSTDMDLKYSGDK